MPSGGGNNAYQILTIRLLDNTNPFYYNSPDTITATYTAEGQEPISDIRFQHLPDGEAQVELSETYCPRTLYVRRNVLTGTTCRATRYVARPQEALRYSGGVEAALEAWKRLWTILRGGLGGTDTLENTG